jgi:hypothetical protein
MNGGASFSSWKLPPGRVLVPLSPQQQQCRLARGHCCNVLPPACPSLPTPNPSHATRPMGISTPLQLAENLANAGKKCFQNAFTCGNRASRDSFATPGVIEHGNARLGADWTEPLIDRRSIEQRVAFTGSAALLARGSELRRERWFCFWRS